MKETNNITRDYKWLICTEELLSERTINELKRLLLLREKTAIILNKNQSLNSEYAHELMEYIEIIEINMKKLLMIP